MCLSRGLNNNKDYEFSQYVALRPSLLDCSVLLWSNILGTGNLLAIILNNNQSLAVINPFVVVCGGFFFVVCLFPTPHI